MAFGDPNNEMQGIVPRRVLAGICEKTGSPIAFDDSSVVLG